MNPFEVRMAETMEVGEVGREFVADHTEFAKIAAHQHTLIFGSRGSGKSMHLRAMEPMAWMAYRQQQDQSADLTDLLTCPDYFIGIYVNCRENALSRESFRAWESTSNNAILADALFERYMGAICLLRAGEMFRDQMPSLEATPVDTETLTMDVSPADRLGALLDSVVTQATADVREIDGLLEALLLQQISEVEASERVRLKAPRLSTEAAEFFKWLNRQLHSQSPFYLLFDEANELCGAQQRAVSALLARRTQRYLCLKIATQRHGFRIERASGSAPEPLHDYVQVDLESLYTNNQAAYYARVHDIASERLRRVNLQRSPTEFFPPNPTDLARMEEARAIAGDEYDALPVDQRPQNRANYIKKYAPAIYHREVVSSKAGKSYAGFGNMVHLSSGIVRAFLECASTMVETCHERHPSETLTEVPISIQNEVIDNFSSDYIERLVGEIDSIDGDDEKLRVLRALRNLLTGLGKLFRSRLMDADSREPRIISVSLKAEPLGLLRDVLRKAEADAYLHKTWYRSKRGTGKLPCYVLNRRLCPHFNLDIAGFQGRIEVDPEELERALEDPDAFAGSVGIRIDTSERQSDQQQFLLWEW